MYRLIDLNPQELFDITFALDEVLEDFMEQVNIPAQTYAYLKRVQAIARKTDLHTSGAVHFDHPPLPDKWQLATPDESSTEVAGK